ncbi:MAG: 23S rRNA (uracil(1939)-C(5))-methyltransferase RlmD, partial [Clostridia bacterium]|nr:23S rRNA (uracil(1939)-C(5))-methyltransferase RlmD [Clostridia bacterium]
VVLDPPRKGCAAPLLDFLCRLSPPRIVYISCNPETLARDAARQIADGYVCGPVTPVDLFPRTAHVECVVSLTRRGSNDVG